MRSVTHGGELARLGIESDGFRSLALWWCRQDRGEILGVNYGVVTHAVVEHSVNVGGLLGERGDRSRPGAQLLRGIKVIEALEDGRSSMPAGKVVAVKAHDGEIITRGVKHNGHTTAGNVGLINDNIRQGIASKQRKDAIASVGSKPRRMPKLDRESCVGKGLRETFEVASSTAGGGDPGRKLNHDAAQFACMAQRIEHEAEATDKIVAHLAGDVARVNPR